MSPNEKVPQKLSSLESQDETLKQHLAFALEAAEMAEWEYDYVGDQIHRSILHDKLYGYSDLQSEWNEEKFMSHVLPEDHEKVIKQFEVLRAKGYADFTFRIRRADDGSIRWIALKGKTFRDESGNLVRGIGIIQDITKLQRAAEEGYRARKDAAEAANSAKTSFLAHMSHEMRTPLGAILGFIEILKNPENTQEELNQYIGVIDRNSRLLLKIIDEVLDLSKVEAGKLTIESVPFSLSEMLADFSSLMSFKAREKGLQYELKLTSDVPSTVIGDPTRVRQVLNNAVGNAIKFTDLGYVRLSVCFEDNFLKFTVEDSGRGVSAEEVRNLFQPFSQADKSTTRLYGGTGLGLMLSRKLCESMNGRFYLEKSQPGIGSVFTAEIKVETPQGVEMIDSKTIPLSSACLYSENEINSLHGLKVLVVDDSIDNRALLQFLLHRWGVRVEVASNGHEGLNKVMTTQYDVILMDLQMPQMDGYETTQRIRSLGYQVPIVALTAHALNDERERCYKSGFNDFLSKPVQKNVLRRQLSQFFKPSKLPH